MSETALAKNDFRAVRTSGRPSKLTNDLQEFIVEGISRGNYPGTMAEAGGISKTTFKNWMGRAREILAEIDEKEEGEVELSDTDLRTLDFFYAVEEAMAKAEARHVIVIDEASKKSWQAAAWLLERKFPERYGQRRDVNVSGRIEHGFRPEDIAWARHKKELDAEQEQIEKARKKLIGAGGNPDDGDHSEMQLIFKPLSPELQEYVKRAEAAGTKPEVIAWELRKMEMRAEREPKIINDISAKAEPVESDPYLPSAGRNEDERANRKPF